MRRLISILLVAVFGLPFVLPMLAVGQDAEAGLPAGCRRNGKHHCMMSMNERGEIVVNHDPQFKAPAEKCPYFPSSVVPAPPNPLAPPSLVAAIYGYLVSHPAVFAQAEAKSGVKSGKDLPFHALHGFVISTVLCSSQGRGAMKQSDLRFVVPMECLMVSKLPEGAGWSYEIK